MASIQASPTFTTTKSPGKQDPSLSSDIFSFSISLYQHIYVCILSLPLKSETECEPKKKKSAFGCKIIECTASKEILFKVSLNARSLTDFLYYPGILENESKREFFYEKYTYIYNLLIFVECLW